MVWRRRRHQRHQHEEGAAETQHRTARCQVQSASQESGDVVESQRSGRLQTPAHPLTGHGGGTGARSRRSAGRPRGTLAPRRAAPRLAPRSSRRQRALLAASGVCRLRRHQLESPMKAAGCGPNSGGAERPECLKQLHRTAPTASRPAGLQCRRLNVCVTRHLPYTNSPFSDLRSCSEVAARLESN